MTTKITSPKHPILKKIIQYFLFITKEDDKLISQICYPNTNHCLSLTQKSKLNKTNDSSYTISHSNQNCNYVTGIYKKPISISSKIPYKEVCINFNPLGLESIFNTRLSSYEFKNNVFENINSYICESLYEIVFSNNSIKLIQEEMETFFLDLIKSELSVDNIEKINCIDFTTSVGDIENILCKSYRSTHRYFKNNFDIKPQDFILIKKIRTGMNLLFEKKSISEISYELGFADTSHFIKTFKNYTHQTPSQFKKNNSILDNTLIWNLK